MPPYVPMKLPTLLMMSTHGESDTWVRQTIRGEAQPHVPQLAFVVVEDSHEADRIFQAWAQMKSRKGLAIGGACAVRYDGPDTIARERARYAQ